MHLLLYCPHGSFRKESCARKNTSACRLDHRPGVASARAPKRGRCDMDIPAAPQPRSAAARRAANEGQEAQKSGSHGSPPVSKSAAGRLLSPPSGDGEALLPPHFDRGALRADGTSGSERAHYACSRRQASLCIRGAGEDKKAARPQERGLCPSCKASVN